jgi:hypothetical protein
MCMFYRSLLGLVFYYFLPLYCLLLDLRIIKLFVFLLSFVAIVLSVLRYTASDYLFDIFKLFFVLVVNITGMKCSSPEVKTTNRGWTHVFRKGKQFLSHWWHQSCYSSYKSWMRKGPGNVMTYIHVYGNPCVHLSEWVINKCSAHDVINNLHGLHCMLKSRYQVWQYRRGSLLWFLPSQYTI